MSEWEEFEEQLKEEEKLNMLIKENLKKAKVLQQIKVQTMGR